MTTACTDLGAHQFATGELPDNFFLDCVPQYGIGKAEFSIVPSTTDATAEFPEDFLTLDDEGVETSTTIDPAYQAYAEGIPSPILPQSPGGDEFEQNYFATIVAPVTAVGAVTEDALAPGVAEACDLENTTYGNGFFAKFGYVDTTFSQTVEGVDWNYTISTTPLATFFFATFDLVNGGVDETLPWCATDGVHTFTGDSAPTGATDQLFTLVFHSLPDAESAQLTDLGTFGPDGAAPAPEPAALAATGVDATPLAIAAGSFAAFGLALLGFTHLVRRRRSNA